MFVCTNLNHHRTDIGYFNLEITIFLCFFYCVCIRCRYIIIFQKEINGKAVFILDGRLDTVTAPDLEKALRASLDGVKELTLDFEKLDYISSAGLRVLLSTQKCMSKQGSMTLTGVNEGVMEVFEITGFSGILTIE